MAQARVLSSHTPSNNQPLFITVAIPHYQHRRYLEIVLESIFAQEYENFEIVVSNDSSPDNSDVVIPNILLQSGRYFRYYSQPNNLGYDGNVRFCLGAAQARYVLLLGNDDALAHPHVLKQLDEALHQLEFPAVAFTNYEDWKSGKVNQTAIKTQILGDDIDTALKFYRSFSFVAGLIFDRVKAAEYDTNRWDKSIYYQIYLACRILANHGRVAAINVTAVRKDVCIDNEHVPNYVTKWSKAPWSFQARHTGVDSVLRVTWDAICPYIPAQQQSKYIRRLFTDAFLTLHPYWVMEYRRIANWSFAVGIAKGHWPGKLLKEYKLLKFFDKVFLWVLYLVVTIGVLVLPVNLLVKTKFWVANFLRRRKQN